MASEWETRSLLDVADVVFGYPFDSRFFNTNGTGFPLIRIRDLKSPENCLFTTENGYPDSVRVDPGDLLLGMDAEFRPWRWAGSHALLNQRVCKIVPKTRHRLDREFLRLALAAPLLAIENAKAGTTVIHLNKSDLERVEVPWPESGERRAIAHILGTLDDKIELNRRMSETLEQMARAIFDAWFVKFEPVRAKMEGRWRRGESLPGLPAHLYDLFPDRLVDSKLGEIPEGWEVGAFADVTELRRDQVNPLDFPETRFLHFSIPAFDEGQWPKGEFGAAIKSQKFHVQPGVVLLSKLNPGLERVWLVDIDNESQAVSSTEFLVLQPRPRFGRGFTYCLARSRLFRQSIEGLVTGTSKSHQRAHASSVLALPAVLPSLAVAQAFERQAEPLLARSLRLRRESRTLAALRDALLPALISGKLRVKDAERFLMERGL